MKKVLIIGANGQLGTDLCIVFSLKKNYALIKLTHSDLDITDFDATNKILNKINPDIIINTVAYHKIDEVESNPDKAFLVNTIAVKNLSLFCKENKKILVWFSSDYVFGLNNKKKSPYVETDIPGPINTYGVSKLAGESFVKFINPKYYIIRTGELFGIAGSSGKGGNFVETMIKLANSQKIVKVVNDQIVSPTHTYNLAEQIVSLLKTDKFGLYHATSEGQCSWYEFAKEIFKQMSIKTKLLPVTSSQFPTAAKRPIYSVLSNNNFKKINLNEMLNWKTALSQYLNMRELSH